MYKNIYAIGRGLTSFLSVDAFNPKEDDAWNTLLKKWLMRINLTCLILLSAFLQISLAASGQKVSLEKTKAPITEIFKELRKQSDYGFLINKEQAALAKPVTISVKNEELINVLNLLFADQPFSYAVENKMIVVVAKPQKNFKEDVRPPIEIKGRIVDENGRPLANASIIVKGSKSVILTNENGEFRATVPDGSTLVISYVGYKTLELAVKADLGEIKLEIATSELSEVIVSTGYQKISKERFVGSFASLDSTAYSRRAGMGIIERLDGMVPGLYFDKKKPGEAIQIRGISTLGGGGGANLAINRAPLIVVDNFPMDARFDITSINPNDVENITVLKDAAASSIWGTRAGNGVIVINTKRGQYNKTTQISLSSNVSVQTKPDLYYNPSMSSSDVVDVQQLIFNNGYFNSDLANISTRPIIPPAVEIMNRLKTGQITAAAAQSQLDGLRNTDIRDQLNRYVYRNPISQQHYLNINGGTSKVNYALTGGYNNSLNNIRNSKADDQYTLSSKISLRPIKSLEVQTTLEYSQANTKSTNFTLPGKLYQYQALADANGNSLPIPFQYRQAYVDTVGGGKLLNWQYRPLDEIINADNFTKGSNLNLNLGANYAVTNWINAEVRYNLRKQTTFSHNLYSRQTYLARDLINTYTNLSAASTSLKYPVPLGSILDQANGESRYSNIRAQLNFNKSWNIKNVVNALVAGEASEAKSYSALTRLLGYNEANGSFQSNVDYLNNYPLKFTSNGQSGTVPNSSNYLDGTLTRLVSVLANASYSYDSKYTIYASARRDGANVFGINTNNRWKPLWSVGASWDISKEKFFKVDWMSYMRLRGSFGYSGNINNTASALASIIYSTSAAQYTNLVYAQPQDAPNPNLRWEQVKTINFGLDFTLLKNRLTGSFDFFNKQSDDLLNRVPFDPTSGVVFYTVNSASLKGNGYEFSLNSQNTTGKIQWQTGFNLAHANMVVTKVYGGGLKASDFISYGLTPSVGRTAYGISSYIFAGLDPVTGDPLGMLNGQVSKNYQAIFDDNVDNQQFNGSSIPLTTGNILNSISYGQFTLSFNITGRFDYYFRKPSINYTNLFGAGQGSADYLQRWQKPGDELITTVPSLVYPVPASVSQRDVFYANSSVNVLRADNIKIQDVRFQYAFQNKNFKSLPVKNMNLFLYANNLNFILWRKSKSDFDPDFTGGGGTSLGYPSPRSLTLGLNINF